MKKTIFFALFAAAMGVIPANAEVDCIALSVSVKNAVVAEQSQVLEIVSREVSAAPNCACEIVKVAIEASKASSEMVGLIVKSAATSAPDQMRLIAQCAIAVAPDALGEVQAVISELDPNSGETGESSKSSKSAKAVDAPAASPNPLDFPVGGFGPTPGGPGGFPLIPTLPPVIIQPPDISNVEF